MEKHLYILGAMGRHEEKTNPMEEQYLLPSRFTLEFKYSRIVYNGPQYREATLKENYALQADTQTTF